MSEDKLSKFAIDLPLIKEQISQKIKENPELINLSTLKNVKFNWQFDGKDFVEEIKENGKLSLKLKDSLSEEQRAVFVEAYTKMMLEHFADSKHSETLNSLENADAMAFAMISGITIDKDKVVDGIEAQVLLPSQFYDQPKDNKMDQNEAFSSTKESVVKYGNTPAVRNNNPGNIMDTTFWGKKVPGERFTVFNSPKEWFNALVAKIDNIKAGKSQRYQPTMTLLSYIQKYAPESDSNKPREYAQNIAKYIWGITINTQIKDIDSTKLASAHSKFEDGNMYKQLTDLWIINNIT